MLHGNKRSYIDIMGNTFSCVVHVIDNIKSFIGESNYFESFNNAKPYALLKSTNTRQSAGYFVGEGSWLF